jgi:hypothetical protein
MKTNLFTCFLLPQFPAYSQENFEGILNFKMKT